MKKAVALFMLISCICHAQTYRDYCIIGSKLNADGRYKEAIGNFSKAIEIDSMNGYAYQGRALAEDKMGNPMAAINDYTWYMVLAKDSVWGCFWRAEIENRIRKYRPALADCNESIRLKPDFSRAYGIRGDAKFNLKDYKGAEVDYDSALIRDAVLLYKYFFHRAAVKYMLMNYSGGSRDKKQGEYLSKFGLSQAVIDEAPHATAGSPRPVIARPVKTNVHSVASDTNHVIAKAKPVTTDVHPFATKPKPAAVDTHHLMAKAKPAVVSPHPIAVASNSTKNDVHQAAIDPSPILPITAFKNKWLEGYEKDSIITQLKLSRAIATESDTGPLYAARGLIAQRQGRMEDACRDFIKAREMGYDEADEMIGAFCK